MAGFDAWPTFWEHNEPILLTRMEGTRSTRWGILLGVGHHDNGNPSPYYASVHLGGCWAQMACKTRQEVIDWALQAGKDCLNKQKEEGDGTELTNTTI